MAATDSYSRNGDMPSEEMFDLYSAPDAPASKKKASTRHRGECSKKPPAKKSRTEDPPAAGPSKNITPPPSPLKQQTPPAPVESTPSPPAPAMLTMTVGRLRSGVITEQSKASEQWHTEELKAVEAKYVEQLEMAQKVNAALLEEKNKLAEEMKGKQTTLDKALEAKEKYKESHLINFRKAKKLEADLIESRQEAENLEAWINNLEKANTSNLERNKGATSKCFYDFWKHNQGANFSYLPERMRQTEIARCVARLAEEEREKIPASPEISLATGVEGTNNEAEAAADQENPQDPHAS
ncbi:uncharacterized protein LOC133795874 [Humulus lupulus]|uniref:uncharacterized protein LOC133795874 n=1 Tax=Humulus lupulus TaxID=3486 RepID=UPI002B4055A9|nr:uncharacterized protein LOC133795874 [Humulus lupulus]